MNVNLTLKQPDCSELFSASKSLQLLSASKQIWTAFRFWLFVLFNVNMFVLFFTIHMCRFRLSSFPLDDILQRLLLFLVRTEKCLCPAGNANSLLRTECESSHPTRRFSAQSEISEAKISKRTKEKFWPHCRPKREGCSNRNKTKSNWTCTTAFDAVVKSSHSSNLECCTRLLHGSGVLAWPGLAMCWEPRSACETVPIHYVLQHRLEESCVPENNLDPLPSQSGPILQCVRPACSRSLIPGTLCLGKKKNLGVHVHEWAFLSRCSPRCLSHKIRRRKTTLLLIHDQLSGTLAHRLSVPVIWLTRKRNRLLNSRAKMQAKLG